MKIEEQVLSIEQMKHLQELGINTSDASMYWKTFPTETGYYDYQGYHEIDIQDEAELVFNKEIDDAVEYIPTYTIGDLIEKLPKKIGIYHLRINWNLMQIEYTNWSLIETVFRGCFDINDKPLINTLYDCLCWVAENHKELLEMKKGKNTLY